MRPIQGVGALLLALCSGAAMALGLGDIRVLSKPGQPLVAEIPVISNEPGELDNARVALASPTIFARVGLERPQGLVSNLQFQFAQDARGRAVIRVTSTQAVDQPAINFLIEVEWGQGRLVREYSALVDAPNTAAAIAEPGIEAPQAGASNTIAREPAAASGARPSRQDNAVERPATRPAAAAPAPSASTAGDQLPAVRSGQTLSEIAAGVARSSGHSLDQTMLALLRTNPDAFINGNINRLKQGAVLRTPQQDALAEVGAAEAAALVREQATQWRQARAPMPQPAEAGTTPAASPAPAAAAAAGAAGGARLEIAPAVATDTNKAGTTSGTSGEGEGEMAANEQLQQAKEDIATRDAELQELRTRVADLEKLKQQQQALIAMKDTDLAAAQRRLAETPAAPAQGGGFPLWLIGGLVLIVAAVVAWLAARRRKPSPLPPLPRRNFDFIPPGAATAVQPDADAATTVPSERDVVQETEFEQIDLHEDERAGGTQPPLSDVLRREPQLTEPVPHAAAPVVSSDDWRALRATPAAPSGDLADARPAPAAEPAREPAPAPMTAAHAPPSSAAQQDSLEFDPAPPVPVADAPHAETFSAAAPREFASAGRDRLELAVAYMDLGDKDTARGLLLEVAATGDAATRAEAADLLDRLA